MKQCIVTAELFPRGQIGPPADIARTVKKSPSDPTGPKLVPSSKIGNDMGIGGARWSGSLRGSGEQGVGRGWLLRSTSVTDRREATNSVLL